VAIAIQAPSRRTLLRLLAGPQGVSYVSSPGLPRACLIASRQRPRVPYRPAWRFLPSLPVSAIAQPLTGMTEAVNTAQRLYHIPDFAF
jgi:hypothetical protein